MRGYGLTVGVNAVFLVYNVVAFIAFGYAFSILFAGFHAGLLLSQLISWYVDRKLNREIMEEISTLSSNYDSQMRLFPLPLVDSFDTFFQNNNKQEVTRND